MSRTVNAGFLRKREKARHETGKKGTSWNGTKLSKHGQSISTKMLLILASRKQFSPDQVMEVSLYISKICKLLLPQPIFGCDRNKLFQQDAGMNIATCLRGKHDSTEVVVNYKYSSTGSTNKLQSFRRCRPITCQQLDVRTWKACIHKICGVCTLQGQLVLLHQNTHLSEWLMMPLLQSKSAN